MTYFIGFFTYFNYLIVNSVKFNTLLTNLQAFFIYFIPVLYMFFYSAYCIFIHHFVCLLFRSLVHFFIKNMSVCSPLTLHISAGMFPTLNNKNPRHLSDGD